jgi:hypothetical protein
MSILFDLEKSFPFYSSLSIEGERTAQADGILCSSIQKLHALTIRPDALCDWIYKVRYRFEDIPYGGLTSKGLVRLNPRGLTEWTVVHELAHAWDAANGWQISEKMRKHTHSGFPSLWLHKCYPQKKAFWYKVGSPPAPCGVDKNFTAREDFAEALTAYLFPDEAHKRASKRNASYEFNGFIHFHDTPRGKFIKSLTETKNTPS